MRINDILILLKEYLIIGIVSTIVLGLIFIFGYKIIYQKLFHGNKKIKSNKIILYGISICYLTVIFGAVFLNRSNVYGIINIHLFSSYIEAYHMMSSTLFRNIILNILLFVPFGLLLPLNTKKNDKVLKVVSIGFITSLLIEIIQYNTKFGIFEIDDVFNNTYGVLIGYGLYRVYKNIKNKEQKINIIKYLSPIIIIIISFLGISIKYNNQEFGNLPFEYNYKINMKNIKINSNLKFNDKKEIKSIYYLKPLNENDTRKKADDFFRKLDTSINEKDIDIYEYTAIYKSKNNNYSLWIDFDDGAYIFNDHTNFKINHKSKEKVTKEEILIALNKIGIQIPENSIFEEKEERYYFNVNIFTEDKIIEGTLNCTYYNEKIKQVDNRIITYKKIKEKTIISEKEAYQKILNGEFQYEPQIGKINNITIENLSLRYHLDSKGYYVPTYVFNVKINNESTHILIKAIK